MKKNKKSTSIALSEDIKKAIDIITQTYDGKLSIKNRSELIEYVTKTLVFQILNDEKTMIDEVDGIKENLLKNGFAKDSYFRGRENDSEEMEINIRNLSEKIAIKIYSKKLEELNDENERTVESLVISLLRKKVLSKSDDEIKSKVKKEMRMKISVELYEKNIDYTTEAERKNIDEVIEMIF